MTENLGRSERSRRGLVAVEAVASEVSVSADMLRAELLDDEQELVDEVAVEMVLRER